MPYLIVTPILFLLGGMLVYYLIMPLAIKFFLSFESIGNITNLPIQLEAKVNEYLSLIMKLIFAFGLSFQLPVVLSLLARIGLIELCVFEGKKKICDCNYICMRSCFNASRSYHSNWISYTFINIIRIVYYIS